MVARIPGAVLRQRMRLTEAKQAFIEEFPLLSEAEAKARHPHASGFFVTTSQGRSYPAFQYREHGIHPTVAAVATAFGDKVQDWSLALWFISANGWLGDRPIDLLDEQPVAVVQAARHAAEEIL